MRAVAALTPDGDGWNVTIYVGDEPQIFGP
jgi:hypothetical protein